MDWFRMYSAVMFDRKIPRIAREAGIKKYEVIGIWTGLLSLANDSPVRGKLLVTLQKRYSNSDVTNELGIDETVFENVLKIMQEYEMIHYEDGILCITNWNKRQFSSDDSTSRVRKHRQKLDSNDNVTLLKRFSNAPDTETDTETDINGDGKPPSPKRKISPEKEKYYELQKIFLQETGLPEPKPKTQADHKEFNTLWVSPGKSILEWVDYDLNKAGILIQEAVTQMSKDKLTIANFKSIVKVASDCYRSRNNGHA